MTTNESSPLGSECNAELGSDERAKLEALLDHIHEHGTTAEGVLRLAAQLCQAARAAERERCAQYLRGAAEKLTPEGKRTNQVDRHTAHVLATKGDELAHGCHVRA